MLVVLGWVRAASAAPCSVSDLCSAPSGACMVTGDRVCDSPAIFDLGSRALVVTSNGSIQVTGGDGAGLLSINAGGVTLQGGATIQADGQFDAGGEVLSVGGQVLILSGGAVSLDPSSRIDVSQLAGGEIEINAMTGAIAVLGSLEARGQPGDFGGVGGLVKLTSGSGALTVGAGGIDVSGAGADSEGGEVDIVSAGAMSLEPTSRIDASADLDGGIIRLDAGTGDMTALGSLEANGGSAQEGGEGGTVALTAVAGGIQIAGDGIDVSGKGEGGGGDITIDSAMDASLRAPVDLRGADGGDLEIEAGGSIISEVAGTIDANATFAGGFAGFVTLIAGANVTLLGRTTATADGNEQLGGGFGGELTIRAPSGNVDMGALTDFSGSGPNAEGGIIDLTAAERLSVPQGSLLAEGIPNDKAFGGRVHLQACTLEVLRDARVSTKGLGAFPDASNVLQGSGPVPMRIDGSLEAGHRNLLEYREVPPQVRPGAAQPPAEEVANPALPCCGDSCPGATTTTVAATTSTTSSTPAAPSTTSSSIAQPSATSTTVVTPAPDGGTTSTLPPSATTSTTTSAQPSTTSTVPPSCAAQAGFDGLDCRLEEMSQFLSVQPDDALGGPKTARALRTKLAKAQQLSTLARGKAKPKPTLKRARKHVNAFRVLAQRQTRRGRIASDVGGRLLELAADAASMIDGLRSALRGP